MADPSYVGQSGNPKDWGVPFGAEFNIGPYPKPTHEWTLAKGSTMWFQVMAQPNWFNRLMQKWFFGFHWRKIGVGE